MPKYINRRQLQKASDEEIESFFAETIFEGIYSSELKSKNNEFYKGSITDIKLEGRSTNLVMTLLNVPRSSNNIPEGPCSFKCRMNIAAFRADESKYSVNLVDSSLRAISSLTESNVVISASESKEQDLFEMWGVDSCQCIGYYHYDEESEVFLVDDLRKPNFDHIPYYPGDPEKKPIRISYPHEIRGIKENDYYQFTWKLSHKNICNPYEICIDFKTQPRAIDPKWFIDILFDDRHNDKSKNFGSATNFLDTLSKQLSARESTFVYELLQNANDYPVEGCSVDVEFHITDNYLLFLHTGDKFNVRNISGICGINEKEKVANKKTIGYKGIGFKTVFLNNHYVYLRTGEYSFRFDEGETPEKKVGGKIKRLGAPFQILPIWTKHDEVAKEVNDIFDNSGEEFRVQIALRPDNWELLHEGRNCYENLFREIFSDSNIILFIPNINSVRVFINGQEERACFRNNEEWIVGDYENEISDDLLQRIIKTIDKGNSRIPEKYKDFDYTKVSFACKHEGAMIKPIEDATLYCYLPTRASWGLPFLMNTDMIPKGDRNDIETEVKLIGEDETNFNEELASIAGSKLFLWIRDLLTSRSYHLGSVFSLVPDFEKCKKEHKDYTSFIEKFEEAFSDCLDTEAIVPVPKSIALVNTVILDTTRLSCSGIMTDDEFRKFAGMEDYYLPLPILRKDKNFNSFLKRYAVDEQKFDGDSLEDLIANTDFQEWLKDQDNNNKFLNFLLENDYLEGHLDKNIFIKEECGSLYSAEELYYDIDKEIEDLSAFSDHLCFLSFKTREFFKNNKKWEEIIDGQFAEFDGEDFINNTLLSENWDDTIKALEEWETSFHFYNYIVKNNIVPDELCDLPFFNDEGEIVDDFNDKFVFLSSCGGKCICGASWLSPVEFSFVSSDYSKEILTYFKENAGVQDFSDDIIVNDIILSDDYHDDINDAQQEDSGTSVDFIKFCFEHEALFDSGDLRNYALMSADCNGDEEFVLCDNHVFFPSILFDEYSQKEWIDTDWMYCLKSDYLEMTSDRNKVKAFLKKAFYVEDIDAENFYTEIVRPKISSIISNTSGNYDGDGSNNLDFVSYLDQNYKFIFEQEKDAEKFESFIFLADNEDGRFSDIESDATYRYAFDSELKEILDSEWFPAGTVNMCSSKYGESKAILAIGAIEYNFSSFFNDVITEELDNINNTIISIEESIAFHNFVIEHLCELTPGQQSRMSGAKVYLYGKDEPACIASGHKILSASAKELFDKGLVEFADLDIIDPDYKAEQNAEYWETRLENTKFSITHFCTWLNENTQRFTETLQDVNLNIEFWRWLKDNADSKQLEGIPVLPVVLKDGSIDNDSSAVYFSDEYMEGSGIEQSVLKFDENALFISPNYIDEDDEVEEWKTFWIKQGIKCEIVDILIETIIPNLEDIEDKGLPKLIADNRDALEKHYEEDGFISHLTSLRVKAHDGDFYSIEETIYIDCEKDEPFPYVELPNQISFKTRKERELIKDIIEEVESDFVETLSEWQQRKLDRYLEMQDDDIDSVRAFHYQFINDLSLTHNAAKDSLKEIEGIENIYLLNKEGEFCDPSTLTMGSVYKPFFDFEGCGIDSIEYVDDSYIDECEEHPGRLFRALKVHCDIQKEDLNFLEDRECAIYFWSKYLTKKEANILRIKEFLEGGRFDDIACVPTKDEMKTPGELYYGTEVSRYVKSIEDWENKIPLKDLPEIKFSDGSSMFDKLPFKDSLDFLDALYALVNISGKERRTKLLQWMIDDHDSSHDDKINEYRDDEHATWNNNKNEPVQIKQLYALDYWEKTLEQYFGTNSRIINKAYFPSGDSFKKACDILQIQTITLDDLGVEPVDMRVYPARDIDHRLYALAFAAVIDSDNWQELYSSYNEKLDEVVFYKCKSILIQYKEDTEISQSLKKFYHKPNTSDFYFVKDLDHKLVYESYVEEFLNYLGIDEDDIPLDLAKIIMDSRESALEYIKKQNSLMLDEDFKNVMDALIPGIKRELSGNEAEEDYEDVVGTYRPSFTTHEDVDENEENTVERNGSENIGNDEQDDTIDDSGEDYELLSVDDYKIDENDELEALQEDDAPNKEDFINATKERIIIGGVEDEVVCEHYRNGIVGGGNNSHSASSGANNGSPSVEETKKPRADKGFTHDYPSTREPREKKSKSTSNPTSASEGNRPYTNMGGWEGSRVSYTPSAPKPFSPEDVRNFGSHGVTRTLDVLEPTTSEVDEINSILGEDLSSEQVADLNYLAQLRLYNNLVKSGMTPDESKGDFVRNAHLKNEHTLHGGKYIHKCSAAGGIMYLSPSIWNKIADDRCVVCVYLGAKANEFMYFNSKKEILEWVGEDDIVIKLTGEEKADVVEELYSGILNGVKGTAYTLIRINSNEKYNSLFAKLSTNSDINETEENEDEY